ncbi:hypothetical protein MC378_09975 [Polaribacter sp. MSW13]|uniref:Uncharacterized protein n=1 Tax=Polaribacter marinus TaxID=2916838 RepID=A0A9X1VPL5_9FLAO|nr:hypothetical protein [Polaribacter marinus]MCI2229493.1 hypothetical protein [Polaribacter marinus]
MKLTKIQIEELYKFTRKHYVEYYDVQTELVDHLANDIESICKENPSLSFEEARDISFKKFGVFGFMDVVQSKESQMTKKYFKLILKFMKEWFQLPKIALTFGLLFVFYEIQSLENAYEIYLSVIFGVFIIQLITVLLNRKKQQKKQQITKRRWLFESIIQTQGFGSIGLFAFYTVEFLLPNSSIAFSEMGLFRSVLSVFVITFFIIMSYISIVVIPKKATELLAETYPEFKLS